MCRKVYYCIRKVIFEVKVAETYLYAYLDLTRIQQKDKALSKNTPLRWELDSPSALFNYLFVNFHRFVSVAF